MTINAISLSPHFWIDFSDSASITESGGSIVNINDISGNGFNFQQPTSGSQPYLILNAINGLSVARFDGNKFLTCVSNTNIKTFSLFFVGVVSNVSSHENHLISKSGFYASSVTDFPFSLITSLGVESLTAQFSIGNDYTHDLTINAPITVGSPFLCQIQLSPSFVKIFINTVLRNTGAGLTINDNSRYWTIGRADNEYYGGVNQSGLRGDICEVGLLPRIASTEEVSYINSYLMSKWIFNAQVGGNAITLTGDRCDSVSCYESTSKQLISTVIPGANGDWTEGVYYGSYYFSFVANEYPPQISGPHTVSSGGVSPAIPDIVLGSSSGTTKTVGYAF